MNDPLNNLPPFYVGQKVVFIGASGNGYRNGEKYKVNRCYVTCDCKDGSQWVVDVGLRPLRNCACFECNRSSDHLSCVLFRAISEQNFPLMTFSEIRKQEEKEVLVDN